MDLVLSYLKWEMLPPALAAAVVFLGLLPYRKKRLKLRGKVSSLWREGALLLFTMFLAGLFAVTLVPHGFWKAVWSHGLLELPIPFSGGVNLIPFRSLTMLSVWAKNGNWSYILINFPGNIVMFFPLGFFPALLWAGADWRRALLCGSGCSLLIECLQLLVSRSTDVDDLILNTLGALCGYWTFLLLRRLAPSFSSKLICQQKQEDP